MTALDDPSAKLREVLAARVASALAQRPDQIRVREERPDDEPLAPAERRMWLAAQADPTGYQYHVPALLHLDGPVDLDALTGAVRDVAERHEALRRLVTVDGTGEPALRLRPAGDIVVTVHDGPPSTVDIDTAARCPFELTRECPYRAELWRTGRTTTLLLVVHHLATDAWSQRLVLDELAARYADRLAGQPLPAAGLQRGDVTRWEREHEPTGDLDWWRGALAGLPDVLDLPTDRPRTPVPDPHAGTVALDLPTRAVREFATASGASVFMVLLAAWQALLSRLAGADDLAVGVPFAGRRRPEVDAVVGCFVDTVVIRGDLAGAPNTRELVRRVREASLAAFAHAEAPSEAVGSARRVQTLLNVYDRPTPPRFPGLAAELVEIDTGTTKFDLTVTVVDGPELTGTLGYRTALFDGDSAERLARWYGALLRAMLADPDTPVDRLPLDAAVSTVTGPARDYPLDRPLPELVAPTAAVVAPDGVLDHGELDRRVRVLAGVLKRTGVGRGATVGVLAERETHLVVAALAAMRVGAAYLPVDPATPVRRIAEMLDVAGVRHVLAHPGATVPGGLTTVDIATARGEPYDGLDAAPDDVAYVIFTSGSTGVPKGVAVEHRSIVHYLRAVLERLGPAGAAARSFALVSTPAADLGLTCLFGALVTGSTLHLLDRETAVDPARFAAYLRAHEVDVVKMVPSHLAMLARHGSLADVLPRRLLILAGEACPWPLVEQIRAVRPDLVVQSHYGPTETSVAVLGVDAAEEPARHRDGWLPLGRPFANAVLHVVDRAGRPVPVGAPGELLIGGPGVARGYLGQPELTAERFVDVPGVGRCYRTGDRVRLRADGVFTFLGRVDDQVKVRGYRVEPGEVAAACQTVPGVAQAVVLPVGEGFDRTLAAWLVPVPGSTLDPAVVRRALRDRLPEALVPTAVAIVDRLPLNPNGKVDRAALPPPTSAVDSEPPATPTERVVADAWATVLGVASVGRDDDFFARGGDSVGAVRIAAALGAGLRVIDVMTRPTVRELAAYLDARDPAAPAGLLHPLWTPTGPTRATVVCVPYGGGSAAAYQPLAAALPDDVAVLAIELPGHDPARPDEPFLPLAELVDRCAAEVAHRGTGPLLVYGHCVGTAAAVALAHRLEQDGRDVVAVVLGAGFPAARLPGRLSAALNRLLPTDRWQSDRGLRELLRGMGGLPDGLDEAGTATMTRALRHDARESEAWFTAALQGGAPRLRAPIRSVVGARDRATEFAGERHREWTAFTERVDLVEIPAAAHYFLKHQADQLATAVAELLPGGGTTVAAAPPETRPSLRAFRTVALGQFLSMIGTQVSAFGLGVWTYQRTGRLSDYALITMLALVPAVLAAPIGGALADRYDRRRVMLGCDLLAGLAMAVLALLWWTDTLAVWHVAAVVGFVSLVVAAQRPAYLAAIAQLVPKPYLPQANALAQLGTGVGALLAPFLGGGLIAVVGLAGVLGVDMVSFAVGVVTLLPVRFPPLAFRRREESFRAALVGGWRFIAARRPMRVMAAYFVPVNFLAAVTLALAAPLVLSYSSTVSLGAVTAAGGLGAAAGSLLMVAWGGTRRRAIGMVGALLPSAVGGVALALATSPVVAAAGLFVWWAATSVLNAHWLSILQLKVGTELLGRVLSVNQMLATAMMPLGFLFAPWAVDRLSTVDGLPLPPAADVLAVGALVLLGWAVLGLAYRPLRRMEDDLPDAVTGAVVPPRLDDVQAEADRRLRDDPPPR